MQIDPDQVGALEIRLVEVHVPEYRALAQVPSRRDPLVMTSEHGLQLAVGEAAAPRFPAFGPPFANGQKFRLGHLAWHDNFHIDRIRHRDCSASPSKSAMRTERLFLIDANFPDRARV
jgi:hypothetical protein